MQDKETEEEIQKKVLLEDKLLVAESKHTPKIIFAGIGGAVVGWIATVINYSGKIARETINFLKEAAEKRGVTIDKVASSINSDPKLTRELQERLIKSGHPQKLNANLMPATIVGAVGSGMLMSYISKKRQSKLKNNIEELSAAIETGGKDKNWQEHVSEKSDKVAETIR